MSSKSTTSEILYLTERRSGPPLLRVHGLMFTGEMFECVVKHVPSRQRVIMPDQRGHGRRRQMPRPFTAPQLASELSHLPRLCWNPVDSRAQLFAGRSHCDHARMLHEGIRDSQLVVINGADHRLSSHTQATFLGR